MEYGSILPRRTGFGHRGHRQKGLLLRRLEMSSDLVCREDTEMPIPWWLAAGSEGSGDLSISLASEESIVSFGSGSYDASEASGCALASNVSKYWLGSFASGEH